MSNGFTNSDELLDEKLKKVLKDIDLEYINEKQNSEKLI